MQFSNPLHSELDSKIKKDILSCTSLPENYELNLNVLKTNWDLRFDYRSRYVDVFTWAIPCVPALLEIAKYEKIIELYSGTGYWAHLLSKLGVNIKCFDNFSWKQYTENKNFGKYFEIDHVKNLKNYNLQDCNLMISWPPYDDTKCLNYIKEINPNILIYIGEWAGGCNGFDQFFHHIENNYIEEKCIEIPQWSGIHDYLWIFKNKNE